MTDISIPIQYRELSERKAALLAGVSRSTFRRRHLEVDAPESITLATRQDGSNFIPFDEVYRIYGERSLENLKKIELEPENQQNQGAKIGSEPNESTQKESINQRTHPREEQILSVHLTEYVELKTSLASKTTEIEQLKSRIEEQKRLLQDSKDREGQERTRADRLFEEVQNSRRLLEDRLKKSETRKGTTSLGVFWPPNWFKQ